MTIAKKLTDLATVIRSKYLITNKLGLDDMREILADKNDLIVMSASDVYHENLKVSSAENGLFLSNTSSVAGRIAINFKDGNPIGKKVGIYFRGSSTIENTALAFGPISGNKVTFQLAKAQKGYFGELQYNKDLSLSVVLDPGTSATISDLRAWVIE